MEVGGGHKSKKNVFFYENDVNPENSFAGFIMCLKGGGRTKHLFCPINNGVIYTLCLYFHMFFG